MLQGYDTDLGPKDLGQYNGQGAYLSGYPLHRENRENGQQNSLSRKTGNLKILPKTQGIWFAQVVISVILKVKDISKSAVKSPIILLSLKSLPSQFCVCNSHKSCKLAQGKFVVGHGENRESTGNLKIQF